MLVYQIVLTVFLALVLFMEISNLLYLSVTRHRRRQLKPTTLPLISVLIPARNEETNIARSLRGMVSQDYPNLEILVLDDNSTDRTLEIINRFMAEDPRIRLLHGSKLPTGWTGKNNALHQLAGKASGEWLFLTDADNRHAPASISSGLAFAQEHTLDFVTGFPQQHTGGFWEALTVPLLFFFMTLFQPLWLIRRTHKADLVVANGQYILIRRAIYDKIGGHEAVRNIVNEDFALAKKVKQCGGRVDIMDLRGLVYCRMYHGLRDAVKGFAKNIYLIMERKPLTLIAALIGMIAFFLAPFGFFAWGLALGDTSPEWFILPLLQMALIVLIRALLSGFYRLSFVSVWLHPLTIILFIYIFLRSFFQAEFGKGPQWKGRSYDVKRGGEGFA